MFRQSGLLYFTYIVDIYCFLGEILTTWLFRNNTMCMLRTKIVAPNQIAPMGTASSCLDILEYICIGVVCTTLRIKIAITWVIRYFIHIYPKHVLY